MIKRRPDLHPVVKFTSYTHTHLFAIQCWCNSQTACCDGVFRGEKREEGCCWKGMASPSSSWWSSCRAGGTCIPLLDPLSVFLSSHAAQHRIVPHVLFSLLSIAFWFLFSCTSSHLSLLPSWLQPTQTNSDFLPGHGQSEKQEASDTQASGGWMMFTHSSEAECAAFTTILLSSYVSGERKRKKKLLLATDQEKGERQWYGLTFSLTTHAFGIFFFTCFLFGDSPSTGWQEEKEAHFSLNSRPSHSLSLSPSASWKHERIGTREEAGYWSNICSYYLFHSLSVRWFFSREGEDFYDQRHQQSSLLHLVSSLSSLMTTGTAGECKHYSSLSVCLCVSAAKVKRAERGNISAPDRKNFCRRETFPSSLETSSTSLQRKLVHTFMLRSFARTEMRCCDEMRRQSETRHEMAHEFQAKTRG